MARSLEDRVGDIADAIAAIRSDTSGMDFDAFRQAPTVIRSVLYSIGVIGEAVKHLPADWKAERPEIPWQAVAGMRDRVVHEYFRTSARRIWDVIEEDLDALERALKS